MAHRTAVFGDSRAQTLQHVFFAGVGLTLLAFVVVGFAPTYFLPGLLAAKLPSLLVHVHAALFVGWIFLFLTQVGLAAAGRLRWHRRLGAVLAAWALVMILVGPPVVVLGLRRPHSGVDGQALFGDLGQLLVFAVFVGVAFLRRRDGTAHKRLMLLGTAAIMLPALARWPEWLPLQGFVGLYLLTPLALVAWDLATLRQVHRVTITGLVVMAALIALTIVMPPTPFWIGVTHFVKTA